MNEPPYWWLIYYELYTKEVDNMGFFSFRKSFKILPGVRLNIGKKSSSISLGPRGAKLNINSKGRKRLTTSIPGTGISYTQNLDTPKKQRRQTNVSSCQLKNLDKPLSEYSLADFNVDYMAKLKEKWYATIAAVFILLVIGIFFPWMNIFTIVYISFKSRNFEKFKSAIDTEIQNTELLCDDMRQQAQDDSLAFIVEAKKEMANLQNIYLDKKTTLDEIKQEMNKLVPESDALSADEQRLLINYRQLTGENKDIINISLNSLLQEQQKH